MLLTLHSNFNSSCQDYQGQIASTCSSKALMCTNYLALNFYFINNNYAQLYQYTQLEVTPNFYAVGSMPCTSKMSVNLLVQKLLTKQKIDKINTSQEFCISASGELSYLCKAQPLLSSIYCFALKKQNKHKQAYVCSEDLIINS